MKIHPVEAE